MPHRGPPGTLPKVTNARRRTSVLEQTGLLRVGVLDFGGGAEPGGAHGGHQHGANRGACGDDAQPAAESTGHAVGSPVHWGGRFGERPSGRREALAKPGVCSLPCAGSAPCVLCGLLAATGCAAGRRTARRQDRHASRSGAAIRALSSRRCIGAHAAADRARSARARRDGARSRARWCACARVVGDVVLAEPQRYAGRRHACARSMRCCAKARTFRTIRKRVYLAGMSGTAKTLWVVQPVLRDRVAGLIGSGGARPPELPALQGAPPFFGFAGHDGFQLSGDGRAGWRARRHAASLVGVRRPAWLARIGRLRRSDRVDGPAGDAYATDAARRRTDRCAPASVHAGGGARSARSLACTGGLRARPRRPARHRATARASRHPRRFRPTCNACANWKPDYATTKRASASASTNGACASARASSKAVRNRRRRMQRRCANCASLRCASARPTQTRASRNPRAANSHGCTQAPRLYFPPHVRRRCANAWRNCSASPTQPPRPKRFVVIARRRLLRALASSRAWKKSLR